MSADASAFDRRREAPPPVSGNGNGYGNMAPGLPSMLRLSVKANMEHKRECYDDLQLEFSSSVFYHLEPFLPPPMLNQSRDDKVRYMSGVLHKYWPDGERNRVQRHKDYRQRIVSNYQPLNREIYSVHAATFFVPSFLKAINENKLEGFKSIMSEPAPGVYTFEIFQPHFCQLLLAEVDNFEKWVVETNFKIMRPNTMNRYGVVLDDFGLETMLNKLMGDYLRPLAKAFFSDVGGGSLDSHHGFIVEYGIDRDVQLGFHVDDAEVTLNVCLGKQFTGGELFFRGVRCDKHVNSETHPEEVFDYAHVPGHAVLHRGRHRHGARATTDGHRINLILWCRSFTTRETRKIQKECYSWCGECQREKRERQQSALSAMRMELLKMDIEPTS